MVSRRLLSRLRKEGFWVIPRASRVTEEYMLEEVFREHKFFYLHFDRITEEISYRDAYIEEENAYVPVTDLDGIESHQFYLAEEPTEYGSTEELRKEILEFISQWVDYDHKFMELDSSFVFLTWLFDRLPVVPYRRALGDFGTGKSRWAESIGQLSRIGFKQGATATAAGVYRKCHQYRGTQIFDENEISGLSTDVWRAITLVLNCAYSKATGAVTRCIGPLHQPQSFLVFGPKLIAARSRTGDTATESRIITHRSYRSNIVPKEYDKDFHTTAQKLRNKLLNWRLDHYATKLTINKQFEKGAIKFGIEPRLLEVTGVLTKFIPPPNTGMLKTLKSVLIHCNEMTQATREMSLEAACLRGLLAIMENAEPLTMGRISGYLSRSEEEELIIPWKAKRVAMVFRRTLDLLVRQKYNRIDDNRLSTLIWTDKNKEELKKRLKDFQLDTKENITIVDTYTLP